MNSLMVKLLKKSLTQRHSARFQSHTKNPIHGVSDPVAEGFESSPHLCGDGVNEGGGSGTPPPGQQQIGYQPVYRIQRAPRNKTVTIRSIFCQNTMEISPRRQCQTGFYLHQQTAAFTLTSMLPPPGRWNQSAAKTSRYS